MGKKDDKNIRSSIIEKIFSNKKDDFIPATNTDIKLKDLITTSSTKKDQKKSDKKDDKKKKKKKKKAKYDYSDINYDGDFRKVMKEHAKAIKGYIRYLEVYAIFEGMTEDEWKENIKIAKKLIKKLKKGDPSVYNIEELNNTLAENHRLVIND